MAHALLALCLRRQDKFEAATEEAQQAIGLSPDEAYPHYVLSVVMAARNRFAEGKSGIQDAIRIEPEEADYWGQLAAVELELRDWNAALTAAERGLQIDAEHVGCTNLRVQALTKLGRRTEADAAVEAALRREPENAYTHANRGWTLLEQRNPAKAMEHFREALRLDPELDWARAGIVEALKAKNFIYRWMLGYFFWMARLSRQAQWGVILGAYVLSRIVASVEENHPEFAVVTRPLMVAYIVFVVLTWLSRPLFNSLLRLNRFGRLVLSREDVWQSNLVCLFMLPALAAGITFAIQGQSVIGVFAEIIGISCALQAMYVGTVFNCSEGWPRWSMAAGAAVYFVAWITLVVMLYRAYAGNGQFFSKLFDAAIAWRDNFVLPLSLGLFLAANYLAMARPKR